MNIKALTNTLSSGMRSLPIVILYVTEGCNLRCISCSYRNAPPNELSLTEIERLAERLNRFGLRHIVYSGGEPLMRRDFPRICSVFQKYPVKQTLLTNGLLLEKRLVDLEGFFTEIIVSLDGPTGQIHNSIRGVDSFEQILKGISRVLQLRARPEVAIRTVVQKQNFRHMIEMVHLAHSLGVDRISFLSADVLSDSFGRDTRGAVLPTEQLMLNEGELHEFRTLIERLIVECADSFATGFISDSPGKLRHIVQYFEALLGKAPFPYNTCNAPMVSAVITSTGKLQPCFFLPPFGNVLDSDLQNELNNPRIRSVRERVRSYSLERCQKCVCTLHVNPLNAVLDRF